MGHRHPRRDPCGNPRRRITAPRHPKSPRPPGRGPFFTPKERPQRPQRTHKETRRRTTQKITTDTKDTKGEGKRKRKGRGRVGERQGAPPLEPRQGEAPPAPAARPPDVPVARRGARQAGDGLGTRAAKARGMSATCPLWSPCVVQAFVPFVSFVIFVFLFSVFLCVSSVSSVISPCAEKELAWRGQKAYTTNKCSGGTVLPRTVKGNV